MNNTKEVTNMLTFKSIAYSFFFSVLVYVGYTVISAVQTLATHAGNH
jgi:hypothetical protein